MFHRRLITIIVGPVGSGKSSLLQGMIGEMRRTAGTVRFKGSVAYCPQSAWIQNATVRDNITFGRPFDEETVLAVGSALERAAGFTHRPALRAGEST